MTRRDFLGTAAATSALAPAQTPQKRPNILHIMSDQQQWATIAGRSECRTPNLDRLAKAGMLFERSYTPSAVCCPARAMLLSGAYHWHNGVYNQVHSRSIRSSRYVRRRRTLLTAIARDRLQVGLCREMARLMDARTPGFGFQEVADLASYRDAAKDNQKSTVEAQRSKEKSKRVVKRSMQWPGSEPFPMWGYGKAPRKRLPSTTARTARSK